MTILMGGALNAQTSQAWAEVAMWVLAAFFGILVHEFGHAIAARIFGAWPTIIFSGLGGLTVYEGDFNRGKNIVISLAGPVTGFALGFIAYLLLGLPQVEATNSLQRFLGLLYSLSILWNVINLLPIMPLDGGHIFRDILGPRHYRITCIVGGVLAVVMAILFFLMGSIFAPFFFIGVAYLNFTQQPEKLFHG